MRYVKVFKDFTKKDLEAVGAKLDIQDFDEDTKMVNKSDGHMAGLAAKAHDEFHDLLPVSLHSPCFLHNMEWTQLSLMFIL